MVKFPSLAVSAWSSSSTVLVEILLVMGKMTWTAPDWSVSLFVVLDSSHETLWSLPWSAEPS